MPNRRDNVALFENAPANTPASIVGRSRHSSLPPASLRQSFAPILWLARLLTIGRQR